MSFESLDKQLRKFHPAKLGDTVVCADCNATLTLKEFTGIAFWTHPGEGMKEFLIAMEREIANKHARSS